MPIPAGNKLPLNLGAKFTGSGRLVGLNLGVEWSDTPVEPPEPVIRGLRAEAGLPWSRSSALRKSAVVAPWTRLPALRRATRAPWMQASLQRRQLAMAWGSLPQLHRGLGLPWRTRLPRTDRAVRLPWQNLPTERQATSLAWLDRLLRPQVALDAPWRSPGLARMARRLPWLARLATPRRDLLLRWLNPALARRNWKIPWGNAALVPWVVVPPKPPKPPPPEVSPFPPGNKVGLNLGCPIVDGLGLAPLNLGVTACYVVRPHRRTYIVLNSVAVVRLPDRLPIEVDGVAIAQSVDAWGASFDLSLCDPAQLALLKPTVAGPREIEITLNGYVWTAIVEAYSTRREWNVGGVSISGRSRTALLAAPYAPARTKVTTEARTVAQLVDEELAGTGYTATYDTTGWLVPAGAWYYDNTTPMDAISRIAEASGAVVQSDPEDLSLVVRPRYPVSPWDWPISTPDVTVFDDIVTGSSLQVRSQPLFDAVVVTGEIAGKGYTVRVKRTGSAGTLYAPQASHPLINEIAAGTERGRNILSDRGEQASIDLILPLFSTPLGAGQTGRVLPLDLVEVQEAGETWHGLCTAARIEARIDNKATVIEQTITLERHYSDAD